MQEIFMMDSLFPPPSSEALKMMMLTVLRDKKIAETDWTQLQDVLFSQQKKAEFATYRQALQDLPQNCKDPETILWPVKPRD